ncbi:MAG: 50S ribosomal protein L21e [Candidatus Micrarchaeota archaeon]
MRLIGVVMMKRSRGLVSKRSRLLRKRAGKKYLGMGKLTKSFELGARVCIRHESGQGGMPHPRYRGRHGVVVGKQGGAYVVEIQDGNMKKRLIIPAVHLGR